VRVLLIFFSAIILNASIVSDFKHKKYSKVCKYNNIMKYKSNEKALSIIGTACVRSDKLYLLPYIYKRLKHTSLGRKNAIYLATIYLQKKLLYSYMFDNFSLNGFELPLTDYILSKIFFAIKSDNYTKRDGKIVIYDKSKRYEVYKVEDKMMVDEFKGDRLIKQRWFR